MQRSIVASVVTNKGIGIFGAVLCIGIALVSYRYLIPGMPIPDVVSRNGFRVGWLVLHATAASTALLVGPWQFWSRLRARRPRLHRWMGRTYVTACLTAGVCGFVLALGASTGPVSAAGFGTLAIFWFGATALAWRLAMRRDFAAHRRWMIRSFALTCAAVTLRLYTPIAGVLAATQVIPFEDSYRAISFLCWVPNLLLAELYLRRRPVRTAWG